MLTWTVTILHCRTRTPKDFSNSELEALSSATVEPKPSQAYIAANLSRGSLQQLFRRPQVKDSKDF